MKKIILTTTLMASFAAASFAQSALKNVATKAQTAQNVATALGVNTTGIMNVLKSQLGLTALQNNNVLKAITTFAGAKSKIASLANSDAAGYAKQLTGLQTNLNGSLKTALTAAQYTKFLGLKPAKPDVNNVLSGLFY